MESGIRNRLKISNNFEQIPIGQTNTLSNNYEILSQIPQTGSLSTPPPRPKLVPRKSGHTSPRRLLVWALESTGGGVPRFVGTGRPKSSRRPLPFSGSTPCCEKSPRECRPHSGPILLSLVSGTLFCRVGNRGRISKGGGRSAARVLLVC